MQKLTKEQTAALLAEPNGPEKLAERAPAAFDAAWALFIEEGSPAACSFLCRLAKRREYREAMAVLLEDRAPLWEAIASPAPKLRKNAARLAGELGNAGDVPALIASLKKEEQRFVRPSQILALGALGGETAEAFFQTYRVPAPASESEKRHAREEQEALDAAHKRLLRLGKHTFTRLPFAVEVELRGPDKLGEALAGELRALGYAPAAVHSAAVRLHTEDLPGLFQARSFFELLLPASAGVAMEPKAIAQRAGAFIAKLLPACHAGAGPFGYRIEVRAQDVDRGTLAREIARGLDGPMFANAPSDYEVELRVEQRQNGGANLYMKLFTLEDHRFDYRLAALPASMHPATAAAVLRSVRAHLASNARVLDPCCGSGTFLIERSLVSPCASLTGVDIAHAAVDIARKNAEAAGCPAKFMANDCLRFSAQRPYDELIANLPFGNRVGTHADNRRLYAGILERLPQWLKSGGIAILYTMEYTLLKNLIRERPGLSLLSQMRTEAGGLMPTGFVVRVR
ncbi:MAG: methyltransferase [Candidatus Pelethousia sp.]|nr:methyltransferase [Candidatus Pelethousia sp.]